MPFDFPSEPSVGDVFENWIWDGAKWICPTGGVTDGSNAAPGQVGEYLVDSGSLSVAFGAWARVGALALTAGDWDCSAYIWYEAGPQVLVTANAFYQVHFLLSTANQAPGAGGGTTTGASWPFGRAMRTVSVGPVDYYSQGQTYENLEVICPVRTNILAPASINLFASASAISATGTTPIPGDYFSNLNVQHHIQARRVR